MAISLDRSLTALPDPSAPVRAPAPRSAPPPAPLNMPVQRLGHGPARGVRWPGLRTVLARLTAFGGALALAWFGIGQMLLVFGNETLTTLQILLLGIFSVSFTWIALSTTQALAALFAPRTRDEGGPDTPPPGLCAILMPVYNEDPSATMGRLWAMAEGLAESGHAQGFEIFILSDSTNPAFWVQEAACHARLRQALDGKIPVWYRRRPQNTGRKAGNLRDFVERWGARYDTMLVLDADSLMAPDTMVRMVRRMAAAPRLGILQTVPMQIGGQTLFARLQQFAGYVYGPLIARGVSAWQGLDGNYWGHNALIRVGAFARHCGLPDLPGRKPFGGHILSHDFVEAALMVRGGWQVRMDTDLGGSWEGSPPSLLDFTTRDRRWAQGNLQHLKVIGARGLALASRIHFGIGIGSYLMSPIWLALLVTGALLTTQSLIYEREYFSQPLQLFPDWPVFDARRMLWLFALSMGLLLLPKALGLLRMIASTQRRRHFGGAARIILGGMVEIVLSALFAPVLMLAQVRQVWEILSGRDSGWATQSREGGVMPWSEALLRYRWHVVAAVVPGTLLALFSPVTLIWLSPVLAGWFLAPVLARASGDERVGRFLGLLTIPEDREPPAVALRAAAARAALKPAADRGISDLVDDTALMRTYVGTLPDPVEETEAAYLLHITARAKILAAASGAQALGWLNEAELRSVLTSGPLLALLQDAGRHTAP